MNYVGIDPSLISTAVVINDKMFNYCKKVNAYNKTDLKKWYKYCENFVTYKFIEYKEYKNYSDGELIKLKDYDKITDEIVSDIKSNIDKGETRIGIEGYAYASDYGDLIDLVTFSTLLRKKLYDKINKDITIFSPSTLKMEACKLTYPAVNKGKKKIKLEWRNNEGIAGGHFTKREILLSIIDNEKWDDKFHEHLLTIKDELLSISQVPKPYEDLDDAYILSKMINQI
jgi:hypothetical protein